jgi:tRNA 2-selenouridine synthase
LKTIQRMKKFFTPKRIILDCRAPIEFQKDHVFGSINTPVLDNEQRAIVGTLYKNDQFEAKKLGAVCDLISIKKILKEIHIFQHFENY